jgi:hypothetical protein
MSQKNGMQDSSKSPAGILVGFCSSFAKLLEIVFGKTLRDSSQGKEAVSRR